MDICSLSFGVLLLVWGLAMAASFASMSLTRGSTVVRLRAFDPWPLSISLVIACLMTTGLLWLSPLRAATCFAVSALCFLFALGFRVQVTVYPECASLRRYVLGFIPWSAVSLTSPHASYDACPFSGENWFWIGGDEFAVGWWGLPEPSMKTRVAEFNAAVSEVRASTEVGIH